ncbi:MAG: hypothetical protein ACRDKI_08040 [Solirubrobacterales bacterium]
MKARLIVLAALACAAFSLNATVVSAAGTPTQDAQALAGALFSDPARIDPANTGWANQPLDTSGPTAPATTAATIDAPINGFPAAGSKFIHISGGNPARGYDAGATSDGMFTNPPGGPDHGDANDVSTLRLGLLVPSGGDCLTFSYRVYTTETPTTTSFNEGLIAQIDRSDFAVDPTTKLITAPGDFALLVGGSTATVFNIQAAGQWSTGDATGTGYQNGSPIYTATGPITSGAHQLFLSAFDVSDHEADTGASLANLVVGTTAGGICGALVYNNSFSFKPKSGTGSAAVNVTVPNPGSVTVYDANGPKVKLASVSKKKKKVALIKKRTLKATAPGVVKLPIKLTSAGKRALKAKGKLKVNIAIAYKPTGGTLRTKYTKVTIKAKKHRH